MYVELRHLRTIRAIQQAGGLARAAEVLNMTQSALSHQVAGLEAQAGMELFVRRSKPMRLSSAGHRMLRAAERILPEIDAMEEEFRALRAGRTGRLHIAIECHACFDWLFPVLEMFRHAWPEIDVDIRAGLAFEALPALNREDVDLVISSDREPPPGDHLQPAFRLSPDLRGLGPEPVGGKGFHHGGRLSGPGADHLSGQPRQA
jgi:LysR family transcriptional regulator, regulator for metE and metH